MLEDIDPPLSPEQLEQAKAALTAVFEEANAKAKAEFEEKVAALKAEMGVEAKVEPKTLKDYKTGQKVEVLSTTIGAWVEAFVTEISGAGVHVHTERGPITIGTPARIRPISS